MKRFLVFAGNNYYPGGGWTDFRKDADTIEAARELAEVRGVYGTSDWVHVVDTQTGEIVWERNRDS